MEKNTNPISRMFKSAIAFYIALCSVFSLSGNNPTHTGPEPPTIFHLQEAVQNTADVDVQFIVLGGDISLISFEIRNTSDMVVASGSPTNSFGPSTVSFMLPCDASYTFVVNNGVAPGLILNAQVFVDDVSAVNLQPPPMGESSNAFYIASCGPTCDLSIDDVVVSDASCSGASDGSITISASCNDCSSILYSIDGGVTTQSSPSFTGLPATSYTPYVEDSSNSSCNVPSTNVNVAANDSEDPIISCPANTNQGLDTGQLFATVNHIAPASSSDNCPSPSISYAISGATTGSGGDDASGSMFNLGVSTVLYTITDASNNTASCSFTVTVSDVQPEIHVQYMTADIPDGDNTPTLAKGTDFGTVAVSHGSPAVRTFTIQNTGDADLVLPASPISFSGEGATAFSVSQQPASLIIAPSGSTSFSISFDPMDGQCGSVEAVLALANNDSNEAPYNFSLIGTGTDDIAPEASCPANVNVNTAAGTCDAVVTFAMATATDNCDAAPSISYSQNSGTAFSIGTTTVSVTATDANNNSGNCSFMVTVTDGESPVVSCPQDIETSGDANTCSANVTFSPAIATDNCDAAPSISYSQDSGTNFGVGVTTVTVTATDASNNAGSCSFMVTVTDGESPVANCPDTQTVSNDTGQCGAIVNFSVPSPTDNCSGATSIAAPASGSFFNIGTTPVTVTATDAAGNTATCSFNVIVNDEEGPTPVCPPTQTVGNDAGQCGAMVSYPAVYSTDNCPGSMAIADLSPGFFPVGATTITVTATDGAGNTNTCTFDVVVNDTEAPSMSCTTYEATLSDGSVTVLAEQLDGGSTDNCGIANTMLSQNSFTCDELGPQLVTLTGTDGAGNVSTCQATVNVTNNAPPIAICANPVIDLNSEGTVSISAALLNGGSSASCGEHLTFTASVLSFSCDDLSSSIPVLLTVTDQGNGMSANCTANVTVEDPNGFCCAPANAVCQNITVELDAQGLASITPSDIALGSTAECGLSSESIDIQGFDCSDLGANTVTYSITDFNNATDQCEATVTVVEGSSLPSGWYQAQTGNAPGSEAGFRACGPQEGEFTVVSGGLNPINGTADNLGTALQSLCGDGTITAKVAQVANGYAGVLIRENTAPGSRYIGLFTPGTSVYRRESRVEADGQKLAAIYIGSSTGWMRLQRTGNLIRLFKSNNGIQFQLVTQVNMPFPACVEWGIAAFSIRPGQTATASFSEVELSGSSQGLNAHDEQEGTLNLRNGVFDDQPGMRAGAATPSNRAAITPNLSTGSITLHFPSPLHAATSLVIYNNTGQVVQQLTVDAGTNTINCPTGNLPTGQYAISIQTDQQPTQMFQFSKN